MKSPKLFGFFFSVYFWLCWVFIAGFSLVVASRCYSLFAVHKLLIAVAYFVVEHGVSGAWASVVLARGLQTTGSVVAAHRLRCSVACGEPVPPLAGRFFTTEPPRKPKSVNS